ncbi:MAG: ABC transporter permease, partial [Anaerolineales bacterium]|nr:ABC transporter permease [Anaerolineales bacterium]
MDPIVILQAGVASGTVLLFATLGEVLAERSGVLNLGVEGMMLIGAMAAFSTTIATGNPWIGVLAAMIVAGLLSQIHAFIVITLQADQVVSGLALTLVGAGISLVLGEGLSKAGTVSLMPSFSIPLLALIPILGPIFFTNQSVLVYIGYLMTPLAWYYINHTRPGL